jgi:hypothetical protein
MRNRRQRLAWKGFGIGEELVEHDPDREQVSATIHRGSKDLLGRHVARRADHVPGVRGDAEHASDAEIENLQAARPIDHQVGRLDIAVDDRHLVRVTGTTRELLHPAELVDQGDRRLAADHFSQRFAGHVLHDDVWLRGVFAEVVHGDDMRVRQGCGRARFTGEAFARVRKVEVFAEHFDRDEAAEQRVVRGIDRSHASASKASLDLIASDLSAWFEHAAQLPRSTTQWDYSGRAATQRTSCRRELEFNFGCTHRAGLRGRRGRARPHGRSLAMPHSLGLTPVGVEANSGDWTRRSHRALVRAGPCERCGPPRRGLQGVPSYGVTNRSDPVFPPHLCV